MQISMPPRYAGFLLARSAMWLFAATSIAAHANSDSALQGNPVDALPKVDVQTPAPVTINVETPQVDPAMQTLLSSYLTPSNFQISGVNALPFEEVAAVFTPLINRQTTVAELLAAANKVTQMYQERGYPLSAAFIPTQSFANNVVMVTVVEGYVSKVNVEGNPGGNEAHLRAIAAQLLQERPLRRTTFDRVASILSLQPGVRIAANIAPPTTTDGAAELTLVVRRKPLTVGVGVNYLQPGVRGILSATANGLLSMGEQMTVSTLQPSGKQKETYYGLHYVQPLGPNGLMGKLNWTDYRAKPENSALEAQLIQARYQTRTSRIGGALSYPLILANTHHLSVNGGVYEAKNSQRYTVMPQYGDQSVEIHSTVRVVHAEMTWTGIRVDQAQRQQVRNLNVALHQGLAGLGSKNASNNVDLGFTKVTLQASQTNQMAGGFGTVVSTSMQYSSDILPSAEQIAFGGRLFGLGYAAGDLAGDKGWGVSAEINRLFVTGATYLKTVQPYVLADYSRVYGNAVPLTRNTLASVAMGMRITGGSHYSFDMAVAKPLGDLPANSDTRSPRLNLMYSYQMD